VYSKTNGGGGTQNDQQKWKNLDAVSSDEKSTVGNGVERRREDIVTGEKDEERLGLGGARKTVNIEFSG